LRVVLNNWTRQRLLDLGLDRLVVGMVGFGVQPAELGVEFLRCVSGGVKGGFRFREQGSSAVSVSLIHKLLGLCQEFGCGLCLSKFAQHEENSNAQYEICHGAMCPAEQIQISHL
jgi:hypothetical protein